MSSCVAHVLIYTSLYLLARVPCIIPYTYLYNLYAFDVHVNSVFLADYCFPSSYLIAHAELSYTENLLLHHLSRLLQLLHNIYFRMRKLWPVSFYAEDIWRLISVRLRRGPGDLTPPRRRQDTLTLKSSIYCRRRQVGLFKIGPRVLFSASKLIKATQETYVAKLRQLSRITNVWRKTRWIWSCTYRPGVFACAVCYFFALHGFNARKLSKASQSEFERRW